MAGKMNKKKIITNKEDSILKSNELSTAKLSQGLTLRQIQLLSYAIYAIQKDGETTFKKIDFEEKFQIEKYHRPLAKEDAKKLMGIGFSLESLESDSFDYLNIFQRISYSKGLFTIKWTEDVIPHILSLREKFVLTDLTITAQFNSSFSWILYDYLKGLYGAFYITLSKEALMKLFGVEEKKSYRDNTGLLKNKVLDVAIEEINKFTELEVKYKEIKKGRKITGFKLMWSTGKRIVAASEKQIELLNNLLEIMLDDLLVYAEIKDQNNREEALKIVRKLQNIEKNYLQEEKGLATKKVDELIRRTSLDLEELNRLLENEETEKINISTEIPIFNWLEEE